MVFLRRLPRFDYLAPASLAEACSLLQQHPGEAKLLAGGTDLLIAMKRRSETPQFLVGLKNVPGLDYLRDGDTLSIGPLVTLHQIETSPAVRERWPILLQAADRFGSTQIRNLATVAGNICNASPSADTAPSLLVLGASLRVLGPGGERTIPIDEFFVAPFKTVLGETEVLAEIQVPAPPRRSAGAYIRHALREAMDHAMVGVAVMLHLGEGNTCQEARIALGACAPTPRRAHQAEAVLRGQAITEAAIAEAARVASQEAEPRTDPDYKREVVQVLTRRALKQALTEAQGK